MHEFIHDARHLLRLSLSLGPDTLILPLPSPDEKDRYRREKASERTALPLE